MNGIDLTIFGNFAAQLRSTIFDLMSQNADLFLSTGLHIFSAIAIIMIVLTAVKIQFGVDKDFSGLGNYLFLVLCCLAMLKLYNTPSALFGGESFSRMIPKTAFFFSDQISSQTQTDLTVSLQGLLDSLKSAGPMKFLTTGLADIWEYLVIIYAVATIEIAMFSVLAYGYLALGVVMLFGPLFIPWLLVPKLDWLFWGWFKALLKYSFYIPIASAILFLICKLMLVIFTTAHIDFNHIVSGTTVLSTRETAILLTISSSGVYCISKIPGFVSDLFSGSAAAGAPQDAEAASSDTVNAVSPF